MLVFARVAANRLFKESTLQQEKQQYDYAAQVLAKPKGTDIKAARLVPYKHTQREAAESVHRKDSARWREWESDRHPIDMAVWELYLIKKKLRQVAL